MSNPSSKEHTSIRVHAPPGGHSNNIFSTSEFEQSAANKKKHMTSDIFGSKQDAVETAAPVKQSHNAGNNIFGSDAQETAPKPTTLAGQYKQTQMKSNIFGSDEPTTTRTVSDKNKSNIFGSDEPTTTRTVSDKNKSNIFGTDEPATTRAVSDKNKSNIFGTEDTNKRQTNNVRQGLRDPNASRMGYNPINGESYSVNTKPNENEKPSEESTGNGHEPTNPTENDNTQTAPPTTTETNNNQKVDNAPKNVHTSVRVFHPPGGKSNGPLW